ncbi:zinc finger protein 729-like [Toxorhynchites rutilus septentrionalis]|uniref:zinc finger protein 729-like n=1 Tax=Toxorhynchites rutilus septentrionalis TaxID=329112 RepID=UPI00247A01E9|nr:zinc finger protein 729-like [Toxorhynchites rutilus septentrionalis]
MDGGFAEIEEIRRLRCRLCFHAAEGYQLNEIFTKTDDLSKRVLSALGVKINRSEKQAKICTVCATIIDIIQSFQAVCKQTNQLHNSRNNFLLYDTFWDSREQDAVKATEKIILKHRSNVDNTISGTIVIPKQTKIETNKPLLIIERAKKNETNEENERPRSKMLRTEIVICEAMIKQELLDNSSQVQLQPELEEVMMSDIDIDGSDVDSDSRPEEPDSASSVPACEGKRNEEECKPNKRSRIRKSSIPSENDGSDPHTMESDDEDHRKPRRRARTSNTSQKEYDNEHEPKVPGKRGPRRKKVRKSDPSVCDICGQTVAHFVKESHHNQHLGIRPYKCDYDGCGRSYFSQNDLRTHSKRHQITYHVCEICGRNIKGVEWFRRHVKTHTEGPQFTCEVCGSKFRRKAQLQTHMVTHTGLTPHECEICGKRFALKYNLEAHVKRHRNKEDDGKANEQQKDVPEKRTWKYYVKSENSGRKHHVTCETCGKLVHKREIEGHVNKHLDRRPYSCDVPGCTLAFYGLRGIKEHKMVVHSDKVLRYECSICNRSIKGAGTFKRHVMMHNSNMKVECQYCGKKFTSKSYLKAHEQKHSGERPFVCEICGRSFAMKPCWKMHMKTVHNQDRREPMRVRKRNDEEQQVHTEQQAASKDEVLQESISDQQQYLQPQLPSQQQQQQLLSHSTATELSQYTMSDSVRTDYSY